MILILSIVGGVFLLLIIILLMIVSIFSWNIPITVLRFTGNKHRPMVLHKKGKKQMIKGVPHLRVRGYKETIRDFKSDFYWPAHKSKYGALVLWEFEDGWLTPTIPKKQKFTVQEEEEFIKAMNTLKEISGVNFEYDKETHHKLLLKVIDDVDSEFFIEQLAREDRQYSGGFWAFMEKYGNHITIIFIAISLLVGFIIYMQNAPNLGAQCLSQLGKVVEQDFLQKVAENVAPKG